MKTVLLLICLLGASFSNLSAKARIKHNTTETICTSNSSIDTVSTTDSQQESISAPAALIPEKGSPKRRTTHTGLIIMGGGVAITITGVALMSTGLEELDPGRFFAGAVLSVAGVGSGITGAIVSIVGLAMPRR